MRLVSLVHMAFETPGERELLAASTAVVTTSGWSRRWLLEHYRLDAGPAARRGPRRGGGRPGARVRGGQRAALRRLGAAGQGPRRAAGRPGGAHRPRLALHAGRAAGPRPRLRRRAAQDRRGHRDRRPGGVRRAARARRPADGVRRGGPAGAALAGRELRDGGDRGAGPRPAGGRERGRRRTGSARARRRRQHPRGAGAAGRPRRAGRRAAPLARGPAAPAAAAPFGRAAAADAAHVVADHRPGRPSRWRRRDDDRERGSSPSLGSPGFEAGAERPPQPQPTAQSSRGGYGRRGLVVLGFLVWQLGTGPFLDGLRATSPWAVAGRAGGDRRDDVVLRHALVAGLGAVRPEWAESAADAHGVRRLLPLAADQRDRCPAAWSATCTGPSGTAGAAWSGSAVSASWCRWPWSGPCCCPAPGAGSAWRCSARPWWPVAPCWSCRRWP